MTNAATFPSLVTPNEAMEALQVSYSTLRRMIASGELRAVRVGPGKQIRIPIAELERLVDPLDAVSAPSSLAASPDAGPVPARRLRSDLSLKAGGEQ